MSRTNKLANKARLAKQNKGSNAGSLKHHGEGTVVSHVPSMQPKAAWMASKSQKGKGAGQRQVKS
jgi:hypothetical protein